MRTARTKKHMVADIEGCLAACERKDKMVLALLDEPSFNSAVNNLLEMQSSGFTVVPSESCDNRAYDGNCLGHQTWVEDEK